MSSIVSVSNPDSETVDNIYLPENSVSFTLQYDDNALQQGSIKHEGELLIQTTAGQAILPSTDVSFDSLVGANGLFSQITTEINGQTYETINNYPLMVKSKVTATQYHWSAMSQSDKNSALMIGEDSLVSAFMARNVDTGTPANNLMHYVPFSFSPSICVNNTSAPLSGKKGVIKITCMINSVKKFLYGSDSSTCTFQLRNLRTRYKQIPDPGNVKVTMAKSDILERPLTTNNAQYSISTPLIVSGVSCVFQDKTLAATANTYVTQTLPGLERVSFDFNNVNNRPIEYDLTHPVEWLMNYKQSWGVDPRSKDGFNFDQYYYDGSPFGLGVAFNEMINLSQQAWQMNVQSAVDGNRPMVCFMIFYGAVTV